MQKLRATWGRNRRGRAELALGGRDHVVGTSKTFRQLARIAGAAPSAEGPYVQRVLRATHWRLGAAAGQDDRRASGPTPGVSRGARELLPGALVADAAMDLFGAEELEICPWALREGVILRRLDVMGRGHRGGRVQAGGLAGDTRTALWPTPHAGRAPGERNGVVAAGASHGGPPARA